MKNKIIAYLSDIYPKAADLNHIKRAVHGSNRDVVLTLRELERKECKQPIPGSWKMNKDYVVKSVPQTPKSSTPSTQTQMNFKPKLNVQALRTSNDNSSQSLFKHCLLILDKHDLWYDTKNYNQWAQVLFSYEPQGDVRKKFMSSVIQDYDIYFKQVNGQSYSFDVQKIYDDYPQWFYGTDVFESDDTLEQLQHEINFALQKEIRESRSDRNKQRYKVSSLKQVERSEHSAFIYVATLELSTEEEPRFREGVSVDLKIGSIAHKCEVVEYDMETGELILTSPARLDTTYSNMSVESDTTFILARLQERWKDLTGLTSSSTLPVAKFIWGKTKELKSIYYVKDDREQSYQLDESQKKAYDAALGKDITFIWGPPGTGKSFTLAAIIRSLSKQPNERTVVCCTSNVAIDQLVNKVIDILEADGEGVTPGTYYRAGHATDPRIIGTDFLYPKDDRTEELRAAIKENAAQMEKYKKGEVSLSEEDLIRLKADKKDLHAKLKDHTDYLVEKSKVVFSTISHFVINDNINQAQFDNLIVDEASMLALPQLVALGRNIKKRIILVGDFQQLSPIALVPDELLRKNVFTLCGISLRNREHPACHQLLEQRRSHATIVRLVNDIFYAGNLHATIEEENPLISIGPYKDKIVAIKDVKGTSVRFTKGGTRQNESSAREVINILTQYEPIWPLDKTIGVITPYKGQANLIRALIREQNYPESFSKCITVGTVHTFQGSESDVIICDFVDTGIFTDRQKGGIGKIYAGKDGEQLLNVAVSRARHKLICVGDLEYLKKHQGNTVNINTIKVFEKLYRYK